MAITDPAPRCVVYRPTETVMAQGSLEYKPNSSWPLIILVYRLKLSMADPGMLSDFQSLPLISYSLFDNRFATIAWLLKLDSGLYSKILRAVLREMLSNINDSNVKA